eukprot:TRINITY_DN1526_c0_g1_i3.p1 TRINITY_DN1526_c0_g1~~TRINITY_DN1526_c0_g1_i3.p1  ORF type:complete len:900 (-),score=134.68 TRINITY_DN1526_c0_g1_i3:567-3266(-)
MARLSRTIDMLFFLLAMFVCIHNTDASFTKVTNCKTVGANYYLDISDLLCKECPQQSSPAPDGRQCICNSGFFSSSALGCQQCPSDQVSLLDRSGCILCMNGTNPTSGGECPRCVGNSVQVERSATGAILSRRECQECPTNTLASSSDLFTCLSCPDPLMTRTSQTTCTCPTGYQSLPENLPIGKVCALSSDISIAVSKYPSARSSLVTFRDIISNSNNRQSLTVESQTFRILFLTSYIQCKNSKDLAACQILGNLCALQMFDKSTSACDAYIQHAAELIGTNPNFSTWPATLPWIYYGVDADILAADYSTLQQRYTFEDLGFPTGPSTYTSRLQFVYAKYNLTGHFLGWEDMNAPIQFCTTSDAQIAEFLRFGDEFTLRCLFNLAPFISNLNSDVAFYDLYLRDNDFASLRAVPVKILNYRDNRGDSVNDGKTTRDTVFTRRFFILDSASGRSASKVEVVRFMKSATLNFQHKVGKTGRIYLPILEIEYEERLYDDIIKYQNDDVTDETLARPTTSFRTHYSMNAKDFWSWFEILAGLSAGFTGIMWMYELAVFMRQRRNFTTDGTFLGFMVASLCQYAARYMFYMLGIMSLYFFTNYKGQAELNVLLPFSRDLMKFENMLITAFVCQTVAILHLMKFQTSADFFIIDWEKPRSRLFDKEQKQGRVAPVPVWRSLFVANELNEVLNESRYSLETTLFGLLFFLEVLQLNYLGVERPGDDLTPDETHPILRYACAAIFWSVVMIMQYLYVGVIKRKLSGDPFDSFLDFMSVCNISLMILDNGHHGYYLHGRSVHNFADTDNQELDEMMKRERENLCGQRGLIPNTELQSFEIFITPQLRQKYDEALKFTVKSAAPTTARQPDRGKDKSFDTAHVEPRFKACKAMNIFLTRFVDQVFTRF